MKISLCVICGNEANDLPRCLESAKTAFDELCLVRAIGSLQPDNTVEAARMWCVTNGKHFRFQEYKNTADLPHVDNFGAARNLSFSLATGDWLLWLDCDDYLDDLNCRRMREAVETCPEDRNGIFCAYLVENEGAEIIRERLIRRGKGTWRNAIHEDCAVIGESVECPQIKVYHSGHKAKRGTSAARNLAILERVVEWCPRHYFYLHAELKATGKLKESCAAAKGALVLLAEDQIEERYLVHLNLSELEPERRIDHLLAALRIQPHRREAFAYLCQASIIDGNRSDAISYFRLMDSLPVPAPVPWTHQGIWYGKAWGRNLLRVRVLKISGNDEQADAELAEFSKDPVFSAEWLEHSKPL